MGCAELGRLAHGKMSLNLRGSFAAIQPVLVDNFQVFLEKILVVLGGVEAVMLFVLLIALLV